MKLAAYYPWVYLKGGAERTLLELLRRSRHDWTLYTNHYDADSTFPGFAQLPLVELDRISVNRNVRRVGAGALRLLTQRLPLHDAQALMVCSESLGNLITIRNSHLPTFCLCLTPLKIAHDPLTRRQFLHGRPGLVTRLAVSAFAALDRLAWRRYQRVVCISQEVATRVQRARLAPAQRIQIAYPGVDLEHFKPGGSSEPYFLAPGRIMWTKNLQLAIEAYLELVRRQPAARLYRLVIAGMLDRKSEPYLATLRQLAQPSDQVEFVLNPSDQALRQLYRRCTAVLFTAFNEDWGLVPLEAMASGKPVIAVARGGPLETVQHGRTGLLVEPDASSVAQAMGRLIHEPELAAAMGQAGPARASEFSWPAFVEAIDGCAEELSAGESPGVPRVAPVPPMDG